MEYNTKLKSNKTSRDKGGKNKKMKKNKKTKQCKQIPVISWSNKVQRMELLTES